MCYQHFACEVRKDHMKSNHQATGDINILQLKKLQRDKEITIFFFLFANKFRQKTKSEQTILHDSRLFKHKNCKTYVLLLFYLLSQEGMYEIKPSKLHQNILQMKKPLKGGYLLEKGTSKSREKQTRQLQYWYLTIKITNIDLELNNYTI